MKSKSEFKKKNSAMCPGKRTLPNESADAEFNWRQSSDFFRITNLDAQTSTESTALNDFNSDF